MSDRRSIIVDTSASPHARLRPVAVGEVRLTDNFWAPRLRVLREVTLPTQYQLMEQTGRIDNFRRAAGKIHKDFEGIYFNDSDVYKWIEAVAWAVAYEPDEKLSALADAVIAEIGPAQREDGYLNTYFTFERADERWTNLETMHEMYLAGHLFQAAVAHHRATGRRDLLEIACRFADHIASVFGPGLRHGCEGHPEPEMALVELYRETGEQRYLDLACFLLNERGHGYCGGAEVQQDHKPFRELREVVGHAVRAMYLNCGAADIFMETGDATLLPALEAMWRNLTARRMYVTGGVGARYEGEAFGADYELPNERAYAETCAAIGNAMWQWRMFLMTGEPRYMDVFELALYNGALAGISLDGRQYFYVNPLADGGNHRRQDWFGCACCPPNIARLLAQLSGYFYAVGDGIIYVNLYAASEAEIPLGDATVRVVQETAYPWDGEVLLRLDPGEAREFELRLRIPSWVTKASAAVNGKAVGEPVPGRYLIVRRTWRAGDEVRLNLGMAPQWLEAHPRVEAAVGHVALRRGPLIYCLEAADNPGVPPNDLIIDPARPLEPRWRADLLGGLMTITGPAHVAPCQPWGDKLYLPVESAPRPEQVVDFVAIPYYAWANREPGPMRVWLRRR
ncbi:MAG: glycoside hydrolase family 127 protein [Armatimonadetes bacterium]|nr:glycoside hydrolase family 127 protein [Armatimonadota bacterium]